MIVGVLKVAIVICAAFAIFVMGLVVAAFGVLDPHSSPHAELSKLAGYVDRSYSAVRRLLDTPIA